MTVIDFYEEQLSKSRYLRCLQKEADGRYDHFGERGMHPETALDILDTLRFAVLKLLWVQLSEKSLSAREIEEITDRIYSTIQEYRLQQGLKSWAEMATAPVPSALADKR